MTVEAARRQPASVLVVGAGLAGWRVARELRAAGYGGRLTVVGDEEPYDRPPLSKAYLAGSGDPARLSLLRAGEPESIDVDLMVARVESVTSGEVALSGGGRLEAEIVVVATGSRALRPAWLEGLPVHTLRTRSDADALRDALDAATSLLVLGGGFVGAEVASTARDRGLEVTLVEAQPVLFSATLGAACGSRLERLHRERGTTVLTGAAVTRVESTAGRATAVLADGTAVSADVALAGFGAVPHVDALRGAGLDLSDGVPCDEVGAIDGLPGVYAVGDIAAWRDPHTGRHRRSEHWSSAGDQAGLVAHHLLGLDPPAILTGPPYFWTDQCGVKIQQLGRPDLADGGRWLEADGLPPDSVWGWFREDRLVGVVTFGAPRLLNRFRDEIAAALSVPPTVTMGKS